MDRRNIFRAALAAMAGGLATRGAQAATPPAPRPDPRKVAYHLTDADKVAFVLGAIQNHIDGTGGPGHVEIALVVHGPALRAFHAASADPQLARRAASLSKTGVAMAACGNTMKAQKVGVADLLPGFVALEQGGVVRLAELQGQGYVYLRP